MNGRNLAIDITKGIGIYLVVLGHLTFEGEIQRILIHSFHMPLFMLLSGFLFHSRPPVELVKKFFFKFLWFSYATILIDIALSLFLRNRNGEPLPDLLEWAKTFALYGGMWRNTPIWFLFALLACQVICVFCLKHSKGLLAAVTVALILFDAIFIEWIPIRWWAFSVLLALPFFAIGYFCKGIEKSSFVKTLDKPWIYLLLCAVFVAVALFNGYTDMYLLVGGRSYLLFLCTGLMGTVLVLKISTFLAGNAFGRELAFLGKNTIPILITHYYICRTLIPVTMRQLGLQSIETNLFFQIAMSLIITVGYSLILRIPFSKWFSACFGKRDEMRNV